MRRMSRSTGAARPTGCLRTSHGCAKSGIRYALARQAPEPMPLIRETIVTTMSSVGEVHIAPLGIIVDEGGFIIAPFRPSTTLENLRAVPFAIANYTDDVRVFAGCLTG